jgi:hypothetical protein
MQDGLGELSRIFRWVASTFSENGEWKIVHRHGDSAPVGKSPRVQASTT